MPTPAGGAVLEAESRIPVTARAVNTVDRRQTAPRTVPAPAVEARSRTARAVSTVGRRETAPGAVAAPATGAVLEARSRAPPIGRAESIMGRPGTMAASPRAVGTTVHPPIAAVNHPGTTSVRAVNHPQVVNGTGTNTVYPLPDTRGAAMRVMAHHITGDMILHGAGPLQKSTGAMTGATGGKRSLHPDTNITGINLLLRPATVAARPLGLAVGTTSATAAPGSQIIITVAENHQNRATTAAGRLYRTPEAGIMQTILLLGL